MSEGHDRRAPVGAVPDPDPDLNPATERLTRVLFFASGAAGVIFGALSFASFQAQVYAPIPAFSYLIWALVVGLTAVLCVFSRVLPLRILRLVATAEAVVVLVNLILWLIVRSEPLPVGADVPWIITLTGVPAVCVAVIATPRVTWAYSFAVSILGGMLRAATTNYDDPFLIGLEDALYSLLLQAIFIRLTLATRRGAATVDATARDARSDGIRQAAHLGAKQARLTMDALVHDSVMSTLLIAGRAQASADVVTSHARATLVKLDEFPEKDCPDGEIPLSQLERRLRYLAIRLAPGIELNFDVTAEDAIPAVVAGAIEGAVGEALRNSVAYASGPDGRAVTRSLLVQSVDHGLRVVVGDDGVGFDTAHIPGERLGISRSILARMRNVPGGSAYISSCPGLGVKVVVSWTRW